MAERSFIPERILITRLGAIGDLLCTTPVITNLKRNFPKSYIAFLVDKKYEEVLRGNPYLDELILYDREGFQNLSLVRRVFEELRFVYRVRRRRFDFTIDLLGSLRTALLTYLSGSKKRVGFTRRVRKALYNFQIAGRPVYIVDKNLDTLRPFGLNIESKDLVFTVPEEAQKYGKNLIIHNLQFTNHNSKGLIGLFPGGAWSAKRWRAEKFAELGERIQRDLNVEVLLLGGPMEEEIVSEIISLMKNKPTVVQGVSLKKFGGVIQNLKLFVGNDSGPTHIAIALGIPTITLFGPTHPYSAIPPGGRHIAISRNEDCKNLHTLTCDLPDCCLQSIEVEEVMEKVREVLNGKKD
jgi:lipopolysaccharide heptosyltransferase II